MYARVVRQLIKILHAALKDPCRPQLDLSEQSIKYHSRSVTDGLILQNDEIYSGYCMKITSERPETFVSVLLLLYFCIGGNDA